MLWVGGVFVAVSGLVYYAFLAPWLGDVPWSGAPGPRLDTSVCSLAHLPGSAAPRRRDSGRCSRSSRLGTRRAALQPGSAPLSSVCRARAARGVIRLSRSRTEQLACQLDDALVLALRGERSRRDAGLRARRTRAGAPTGGLRSRSARARPRPSGERLRQPRDRSRSGVEQARHLRGGEQRASGSGPSGATSSGGARSATPGRFTGSCSPARSSSEAATSSEGALARKACAARAISAGAAVRRPRAGRPRQAGRATLDLRVAFDARGDEIRSSASAPAARRSVEVGAPRKPCSGGRSWVPSVASACTGYVARRAEAAVRVALEARHRRAQAGPTRQQPGQLRRQRAQVLGDHQRARAAALEARARRGARRRGSAT